MGGVRFSPLLFPGVNKKKQKKTPHTYDSHAADHQDGQLCVTTGRDESDGNLPIGGPHLEVIHIWTDTADK